MIAGFALKARCIAPGTNWAGLQWRRFCFNDIQPLYYLRDIDKHTFPYIWGYLGEFDIKGGGIEYPVLTGLFMWATGLWANTWNQYLVINVIALAPFGVFTSVVLAKMSERRVLFWAAAPSLVLYAFHNWDLLVVAAAAAGFYQWWKGRPIAAAVAFGVGGALKLYPLLFLVPLAIETWHHDRKRGWHAWWWGIATVSLINLPIAFWNPPSWWLTYRFHSLRYPNVDSVWGQTFRRLDPSITNAISGALILGSIAVALWWGRRRMRSGDAYPFVQVSAAILCAFLLWSKVQSPQYALWVLPFFVLLNVRARWWIAYTLVDIVIYFSVFAYLNQYLHHVEVTITVTHIVMATAIFARALLHGLLFVVFSRSELSVAARATRPAFVSHPVSNLQPSES